MTTPLSPKEIVAELDRFIVGQKAAKRAVAIALRNRWRRQQLPDNLRDEVIPKNILMIGPTGVGKTEIARRLAKLADAPFIKTEATKFTEIGYVGRDVESIIRDLVDISINMTRANMRKTVRKAAEKAAEDRVINAFIGSAASVQTQMQFREKLKAGELDDKEIEIELADNSQNTIPTFDIPGVPGASVGMMSLGDLFGGRTTPRKKRKVKVRDSYDLLLAEESDKLLDEEVIKKEAIKAVETGGIVFLDEIDKVTATEEGTFRGNVSREGVQRDLLPLIEGTTVPTKYGNVNTHHILFITSGAFHLSKPSDLLPELQGRLPIRVELNPLSEQDFIKILTEPEANLILQYKALLKTEGVTLDVTKDAIAEIAKFAADMNQTVENIGARRLHTILETVLEDISFTASDNPGTTERVTGKKVRDKIESLSPSQNLSKFIL